MKIRSCSLVEQSLTHPEECECFDGYFTLMNNNTRNNEVLLRLPKVKLETGKNTFRFMGAKLFNDLPVDLPRNVGKGNFLSQLK